jgi:hypothetical protein
MRNIPQFDPEIQVLPMFRKEIDIEGFISMMERPMFRKRLLKIACLSLKYVFYIKQRNH